MNFKLNMFCLTAWIAAISFFSVARLVHADTVEQIVPESQLLQTPSVACTYGSTFVLSDPDHGRLQAYSSVTFEERWQIHFKPMIRVLCSNGILIVQQEYQANSAKVFDIQSGKEIMALPDTPEAAHLEFDIPGPPPSATKIVNVSVTTDRTHLLTWETDNPYKQTVQIVKIWDLHAKRLVAQIRSNKEDDRLPSWGYVKFTGIGLEFMTAMHFLNPDPSQSRLDYVRPEIYKMDPKFSSQKSFLERIARADVDVLSKPYIAGISGMSNLVVVGYEGKGDIDLFDIKTLALVRSVPPASNWAAQGNGDRQVYVTPQEILVDAYPGHVRLYNLKSSRELMMFNNQRKDLTPRFAVSQSGDRLAIQLGGYDGHEVEIWELGPRPHRIATRFDANEIMDRLHFINDSQLLYRYYTNKGQYGWRVLQWPNHHEMNCALRF